MKGDKQGWSKQKRKEWHEVRKAGPLSGGQSTEDSALLPKRQERILNKEYHGPI